MTNQKKNEDTKTALKLLNKYAESHKTLEIENKNLKDELIDLKKTLLINKDIIKGLAANNLTDKNDVYINFNNEINSLTTQNEKLLEEKQALFDKLQYYEQIFEETKGKEKQEQERMRNKIFALENSVKKKENIILILRRKLDKINDINDTKIVDKEILVMDPSKALNILHDELESYKQITESLNEDIRSLISKNEKYETIISQQHSEISKLRKNKVVTTSFPVNYALILNRDEEKVVIPSTNKRVDKELRSIRTCSDEGKNNLYSPAADNYPIKVTMQELHKDYKEFFPNLDFSKIKNNKKNNTQNTVKPPKKVEEKININLNFFDEMMETNKEWKTIVENLNLSKEEFYKIVYNKAAFKLVKAFELIFKILIDKEIIIDQKNTEIKEIKKCLIDLTNDKKSTINSSNVIRDDNEKKNNFKDDNLENSMVVNNISIIQTESNFVNNFNEFNINVKEANSLIETEGNYVQKYQQNSFEDGFKRKFNLKRKIDFKKTDIKGEQDISNKKIHQYIENIHKSNFMKDNLISKNQCDAN